MTPIYLHEKLIQACENGDTEDVKHYLEIGADPNFNIKQPRNALSLAIEVENHQIIDLLLNYGAIVKELTLQKAIEKNKNYLSILIPDFSACTDETLLMGALQAAINTNDFDLASQSIDQGAKAQSLFLSAMRNIDSVEILELLIENGFNIHAEKNKIVTHWMGASPISGWRSSRPAKHQLLSFISTYYLDKPDSMEKFLQLADSTRLFRIGLDCNSFNIMKFALLIGANKNEALNSSLYRFYSNKKGDNKSKGVDHRIIEYILNGDIEFEEITISNAVCFKYTEILDALTLTQDLEYAYEMAYNYENDDLCEFFVKKGVSTEAQNFAKMKISAIKGKIKKLQKVLNDGAKLEELDKEIIIEIINKNQLQTLKYLNDSGLKLDCSLNKYLNKAMATHEAYECISYLVEIGLDITSVKKIPMTYKKRYPIIADMWEKRFSDIFDYTVYLAKEIHPKLEGKEKENILKTIAELSSLPYVIKCSQGKNA